MDFDTKLYYQISKCNSLSEIVCSISNIKILETNISTNNTPSVYMFSNIILTGYLDKVKSNISSHFKKEGNHEGVFKRYISNILLNIGEGMTVYDTDKKRWKSHIIHYD